MICFTRGHYGHKGSNCPSLQPIAADSSTTSQLQPKFVPMVSNDASFGPWMLPNGGKPRKSNGSSRPSTVISGGNKNVTSTSKQTSLGNVNSPNIKGMDTATGSRFTALQSLAEQSNKSDEQVVASLKQYLFNWKGLHRGVNYASNIGKYRSMKLCISNELNENFPANEVQRKEYRPLVKMCGVASIKDAALIAESSADFIGMILWPHSKRSVTSLHVAKEISKIAQENGAKSVGVFVDDDADTILRVSNAIGLDFVQLHGNGSRSAFPTLRSQKQVIFVLHANEDGELLNSISAEESSIADWILVDSATGGRLRRREKSGIRNNRWPPKLLL